MFMKKSQFKFTRLADKPTNVLTRSSRKLFWGRVLSFLATFYVSYLFTHFVILNLFTLELTAVIIVSIWAGHLILNLSSLHLTKNRLLGDLLYNGQYQAVNLSPLRVSGVVCRTLLTTSVFYTAIYISYLAGFTLYSVLMSVGLAALLNWPVTVTERGKLSLIDRLTGTTAVSRA